MKTLIKNFLENEDGASLVEYAILAALISVVAIATISDLGTKVNDTFNTIKTKFTTS
jgi:pilus assembly protein Flp/PilA